MKKIILLISILFSALISNAQKSTISVKPDLLPVNDKDYKNRIMYEIFIRSFFDSDRDGIGDFNGVTSKMNYLKSMGIEGICLLPVSPSPSYHKYDVTDYYGLDNVYGNEKSFSKLIETAHAMHIKVVVDMVLNHCSSAHPWFLDAMSDKKSKYRDFFAWKDEKDITSEPEHWYFPVDKNGQKLRDQKYYGYFGDGMPDFNYDNSKVRAEAFKIGKYWLEEMKVDGFRLDAAQHIFPEGQETKNHQWWKEFRAEMEKVKPDFYMVGEVANTNEKVVPYLKKGMHAAFNFDLAKDINRTVISGLNSGIVDSLIKIRAMYAKASTDFIDATFIANHDQDRIMSNVKGDVNKAKMAATMLFTFPGSPYIYYGEEIGMLGKKPDELIREPFLWTAADNAPGQTKWESAVYSTSQNMQALNIQQGDSTSIYAHYRKLIALRRSTPALNGIGLESVKASDAGIVAYIRSKGTERVLVVNNVSNKDVVATLSSTGIVDKKIFGVGKIIAEKGKFSCSPYSTAVFMLK